MTTNYPESPRVDFTRTPERERELRELAKRSCRRYLRWFWFGVVPLGVISMAVVSHGVYVVVTRAPGAETWAFWDGTILLAVSQGLQFVDAKMMFTREEHGR